MDLSTPSLAAGLGWAVGMRSATPPAALARALAQGRRPRRQPARALSSGLVAALLPLAAAGELVVDKLPSAPDRTSPLALGGRLASGALVGAALAAARGSSVAPSALAGAAAAACASFVMMDLRRQIGERLGLPDGAVAVTEDVLTVGLSLAVVDAAL